jgi:tetratricopeptide (TPR) repeat protein
MSADRAAAEAALEEARERLSQGDLGTARDAADRASQLLDAIPGVDELKAQAVLVRASADENYFPDGPRLAWAGDVLAGAALWRDALSAYFLLAREAGARRDSAAERRWLSFALGAAQAGGSVIYAPNLLRRLALVELREGNAQRAGELATLALERLKGVPALNARLSEAECLETMGDAWAELGDHSKAITCWRDAMERQESLERPRLAEEIRAKIERASS